MYRLIYWLCLGHHHHHVDGVLGLLLRGVVTGWGIWSPTLATEKKKTINDQPSTYTRHPQERQNYNNDNDNDNQYCSRRTLSDRVCCVVVDRIIFQPYWTRDNPNNRSGLADPGSLSLSLSSGGFCVWVSRYISTLLFQFYIYCLFGFCLVFGWIVRHETFQRKLCVSFINPLGVLLAYTARHPCAEGTSSRY